MSCTQVTNCCVNYAVAEICSGSFNDSIIDSLYTRKLTSTIKTEDMWSIINPIAHGMSSGHSSMGEDSSAMSLPPIVLTSSPISPSDVVQLLKTNLRTLETYDAQLDAMYGSQAYDDAVYGPEPAHEAAFAFKVSREGQALIRAAHAARSSDANDSSHTLASSPTPHKHFSARHLSDTEQGTTAAFPEVTGDGAMPYHYCRTADCRRQAPGSYGGGVRELHCCVHCHDTNGRRHSRECEAYTADNPPPSVSLHDGCTTDSASVLHDGSLPILRSLPTTATVTTLINHRLLGELQQHGCKNLFTICSLIMI